MTIHQLWSHTLRNGGKDTVCYLLSLSLVHDNFSIMLRSSVILIDLIVLKSWINSKHNNTVEHSCSWLLVLVTIQCVTSVTSIFMYNISLFSLARNLLYPVFVCSLFFSVSRSWWYRFFAFTRKYWPATKVTKANHMFSGTRLILPVLILLAFSSYFHSYGQLRTFREYSCI